MSGNGSGVLVGRGGGVGREEGGSVMVIRRRVGRGVLLCENVWWFGQRCMVFALRYDAFGGL